MGRYRKETKSAHKYTFFLNKEHNNNKNGNSFKQKELAALSIFTNFSTHTKTKFVGYTQEK